jgi:hypothetical protein
MRIRINVGFIVVFLFLLAIPTNAKILWSATENRTGHEINTEQEDGGNVSDVSSPVRAGSRSFRHSMPNSGGRAEVKTKPTAIGGTYWYGISYFIPSAFNSNPYTVINQFGAFPSVHPHPCGGIGSKMSLREGKMFFDFQRAGDSQESVCDKIALLNISDMKNKWTDLVMHVKWTGNKDGFLKIWTKVGDGAWTVKYNYQGKTFWNDEGAGPNFKWGEYSGGGSNRVIYTDEMRIGDKDSCFDEVAPGINKPCSGGEPTKFTLQLQSKWNLISLPISPTDNNIDKVLANISGKYLVVHTYDGIKYLSYVPGGTNNTLSKMDAGLGYWIYMTEAGALEITGGTASNNIELKAEWNMVGYSSLQPAPVAQALSSISGKYDAVYGFDAATQNYKRYVPGDAANTLTMLEPGQGYWVHSVQTQ